MSYPVHVLYAIEADSGTPDARLLEQSRGVPFVFASRDSAEAVIVAGLPEGHRAVELTLSARYPEP